jgi:transcriptional antiterminator RfaH
MFQSQGRQWYVIYSKPQKEDYAKFNLRSKGLEVFFPRLLLPESSKRRKRVVPLFPNYLFVRLEIFSSEYQCAIWSPGVSHIVSFNGSPASIDEKSVKFLIAQTNSEGIIVARSDLRVGQQVRFCRGAFDGLIGLIQNVPDGKGRVGVLLKLLSRDIKMEVPLDVVSSSWVPSGSKAVSEIS